MDMRIPDGVVERVGRPDWLAGTASQRKAALLYTHWTRNNCLNTTKVPLGLRQLANFDMLESALYGFEPRNFSTGARVGWLLIDELNR